MNPARLTAVAPAENAAPPLPLLRELGDLKRVRSAARTGSVAERLFGLAWAMLAAGEPSEATALGITAEALAATRLGDLDLPTMVGLGLGTQDAAAVRRAGFDDVATGLDPDLAAPLRSALGGVPAVPGPAPAFVAALAAQPRAGITCPGRPRVVLLPAESHAEHCLVVAVYGVLLTARYGGDPATVFLAGLSHHLHNASLPDSGFTGETLLGCHLDGVMARATEAALSELAAPLREQVVAARLVLRDDATPEGRAFHAADVLDRVLEIEQHLRPTRLTMAEVLGPMALVHDGPVKPFHDAVLEEFGLP